ncbi:rhomboid family intramembrane serine protease [Anatilimnocola sp. NA78]|uniref:rhomboid family intramembrane serine protease n=1 Tax=Anatilimnocola sp. NA78 TaxID=3415683 RepID=UPI003CE4E253
MILPYSTDAPIYYWPVATVGVIVANTFAFLALFALPEERFQFVASWTILTYGNFNPITWITSNYVHGDIFHLFFNMLSLWVFGIIVEGKIGWWKFLILYHAIGFVQCGAEQVLTIFFTEGGSYGASAIIFGLMAIAMIWAPANNVQCVYIGFGGGMFDVTVSYFVGFSLFLQFVGSIISVMGAEHLLAVITSQTLHLMGAVVGAGIGVGMLQLKMVDCENWDAFSVWQGKHTRNRQELVEEYVKSAEGQQKIQQVRESAAEQTRKFLAAGEVPAAWAAYKRAINQFPGWQLPENDLLQLIAGMRKAGMWDETITLMVTFLRTYPQRDAAVRLALAQILIDKKQRGAQACKVLDKVQLKQLDPRQVPILETFRTKARAMADDDPYEVAAEDW